MIIINVSGGVCFVVQGGYCSMKLRYLLLMLIILSISSIFIGVKELSPLDLFRLNEDEIQTLYISRIPRLISIVLAGMSLSICGLIMQQLTRNKFVSPTTAGTMDWARLGVIIAIVLFSSAGIVVKILFAFVFALFGSFFVRQNFGQNQVQRCDLHPSRRYDARKCCQRHLHFHGLSVQYHSKRQCMV